MQPGTPENKIKQPNESSMEQLTGLEYENRKYNLKQKYTEVMKEWSDLNNASQEISKEHQILKSQANTQEAFSNLLDRNAAIEKEKDRIFIELQKVWFEANRADIDLEN